MKEELKQKFLNEAIRIGDNILSLAKRSKEGTYWETMGLSGDDVTWNAGEGLYSGTSGIALFFLELYKQTNNEEYLQVVKDGAKWLEHHCNQEKTDYYAFFTGRLGVSYFFLQLAEALNDNRYKELALKLALDSGKFLERKERVEDLINGISGSILGLIHLHATTREKSLIPIIEQYTQRLLEQAHLGENGLYWDRSSRNITGLCGFSHGAGGIGYVFLELGRYFNNPTFYDVAEEAFAYENFYFDKKLGNWPDLRKGYFDIKTYEEHKAEYKKGNKDFFFKQGNMQAWCHGGPGIGLSRLRAHELLNNPTYKSDATRALTATKKTEVIPDTLSGSAVLCHGHAGNAMLFLDAYRQYGDKQYLDDAIKTGEKLLKYIKVNGNYISGYAHAGKLEDTSLFMGNAGVGYFYLSLCDPENTAPILKPDAPSLIYDQENTWLQSIDKTRVRTTLLERYYPKTLGFCSEITLNENMVNHQGLRRYLFEAIDEDVQTKSDERISSIHEFETIRQGLSTILGDSWIAIKRIVDLETNTAWLEDSDDSTLMNSTFKLEELSTLHSSNWDCLNLENSQKGEFFYLLNVQSLEVKSFELSEFSYDVLQCFDSHKSLNSVLEEINEMYEVETSEEQIQVKNNVLLQAKEAIKSGVLERIKTA